MIIPMLQPKRRRSALETFDGCPYRYDVLYNLCLCGHRRADHVDGECFNQKTAAHAVMTLATVDGTGGAFQRIDKVPCDCKEFRPVEDRGDESQRGIAFHEIAFRYIDRLAKAGLQADAEEAALAYQEGIALTQPAPQLLPDVKRLWQRFAEWFQLDLKAYLSAEERQETERFTWIPDLVYVYPRRIVVKDWKTYYKGLTKDQAVKEFQLQFYMLQALEIWPGFEEYEFIFNFVRLGYEVSIVLTPTQVEEFRPNVEAITLALDEAERTGNYPAIQGSHCGLCRLQCPLADNPLKLPVRFQNRTQAEAAFGRVLMLEQEIKALKKSLAAWCLTEGPLVYHGQEYSHRSSISREFPAAAVIDFLRERGTPEELIAYLTLSKSALGDWANPRRSSLPVLEFLAEVEMASTRWSFKHRKAGALAPAGLVDVLDEGNGDE